MCDLNVFAVIRYTNKNCYLVEFVYLRVSYSGQVNLIIKLRFKNSK